MAKKKTTGKKPATRAKKSTRKPAKKATKRKQPAKKYAGTDPYWTPMGGNFAAFDSADLYGNVSQPTTYDLLAANQDVVFSCVNLIGNKLAAVANRVKLCATTRPGDAQPKNATKSFSHLEKTYLAKHYRKYVRRALDVSEVVDHGLLDLLDRPNPKQSFSHLLRVTVVSLGLCGDAYWYKVHPPLLPEAVEEVWMLPPHQVELVRGDNGSVEAYKYEQPDGKELYLKPESVIHFKYHNPIDTEGNGYSPLKSVWQVFQLLRQEQSSWQAVLTNMAFPSALISSKDDASPLTAAQAERLQKEMRQVFSMGNQGGVWVVQDALEYSPISTPPKDASALTLYETLKTRICNAYHVPKVLLDQQDTTPQGTDTAKRSLEEDCLVPMLCNILDTMTHNLCPSPRLFFCAEDIVTPDRQLELQERAQVLNEVQANLAQINEGRARLGYKPIEGMDKFLYELLQGGTMGTLPTIGVNRSIEGVKKKLLALTSSQTTPS